MNYLCLGLDVLNTSLRIYILAKCAMIYFSHSLCLYGLRCWLAPKDSMGATNMPPPLDTK